MKNIKIDPPVTVTIIRKVKPEHVQEFERLITELSEHANRFPGHLGTNLFRPVNQDLEYRVIYKFSTMSLFYQWEKSDIRKVYYKKIRPLLEKQPEMRVLTGLETWFNLPHDKGALTPPSRHKIAFLSWLTIYPLVVVILECLNPILSTLVIPLRAAILTMIAIPSMTYILMPLMSRLFSAWLYPQIPEQITIDEINN